MKIKELPLHLRPRERLIHDGAKALTDAELLALILRQGNKKENVLEVAQNLLRAFSLKSLARVRISTLKKHPGIGDAKACQIVASFELARRLAKWRESKKVRIQESGDVAQLFHSEMQGLHQEHFICLYLDSRNTVLAEELLFIGTLNEVIIHPREIYKIALEEGAASIILIHNHPSGDPEPSEADVDITEEVAQAGSLMGIELFDHVIIGNNAFFSFREAELL